jgi:hypothetical protein
MSRIKRVTGFQQMVRVGLPLMTFMVGGCYVLSTFVETQVEMKDKKNASKSTRKFDLEEEHLMLSKKLDIDNFTLSRIPREESLDSKKS